MLLVSALGVGPALKHTLSRLQEDLRAISDISFERRGAAQTCGNNIAGNPKSFEAASTTWTQTSAGSTFFGAHDRVPPPSRAHCLSHVIRTCSVRRGIDCLRREGVQGQDSVRSPEHAELGRVH